MWRFLSSFQCLDFCGNFSADFNARNFVEIFQHISMPGILGFLVLYTRCLGVELPKPPMNFHHLFQILFVSNKYLAKKHFQSLNE